MRDCRWTLILLLKMSRVNFFTETFHDFQCWCFYLFFIFSCTNWEARRMCCHNVIWSILVMLEFMTCSAPLQTWKMLTRGFFATQEQASTNHKVYWHQIVPCVEKNETKSIHSLILIWHFLQTHSVLTFVPAPRKCLLCWWQISLWSAAHCAALQHCREWQPTRSCRDFMLQ